ncbi:unnamed protein product [Parnassius mnemosyne]|uniref:Reverse transcriptase n=1 Tax=Parnassius mnemosyne TaxID=213953 RepID=A0AAV1MCD5_9NEOP
MQRLLDLLPPWLDEWRMTVNVGKTTALLTRGIRNFPSPLTLRGQGITYEKAVTYLGCRIDRMLRMTAFVDVAVRNRRKKRGVISLTVMCMCACGTVALKPIWVRFFFNLKGGVLVVVLR